MRGFAIFLLGLRAKEPRQAARLRRIRRAIYRTVAPLRAELVRSAEPIPFAELDRSAFRPLRDGAAWGGVLDCAWLRITGEVPEGAADAQLLIGLHGEALVYDAAGRELDGITTVFQQGDLPHSGGRERPVRRVPLAAGPLEIYADVNHTGFIIYPVGRGRFHGARLARRDETVFALYYDWLTLWALASATEDAALARELRGHLDRAYRLFRRGEPAAARAELAGPLAARSESDFEYSAVGHGHLDMAWLWPLRETRRKSARTYVRQLNSIDERPGYVYGTSQPQQMQWMKERHPALFARMKEAVAAGRLELQGSFWVETDTNMPSGESLVRQAVVGRRFLREEFGLDDDALRLCWLPDTFGYSGNLPQILRGTGMEWFQTIKLAWNTVNDFPHRTFHWAGIDGSTVLVHMPPEGDYNSRAAADNLLTGLAKYPERALGRALLVYGSGDGGGGPGEIHHELLAREHDLRGLPRVRFSRAQDFFRELAALPIAHTHHGELYLEAHQGTYTTNAQIKKHNRLVENALHDAEALAAITSDDCRERLEPLWRDTLLGQFHDILPGSSIARVSREQVATAQRILADLDDYTAGRIAALEPAGTADPGAAPVAINLSPVPRREHLAVEGRWYLAEAEPYASAALAPLGADDASVAELHGDAEGIGNGILALRFGPSGEIVSCRDAEGREHAGDGLNRLVLHRDPYQWPWDAWDIGRGYLRRRPRVLRPFEVATTIDGPTVVRTHRFRFGRSAIEQRVILEAGSDLVRVATRVDWRETHRMLRADFRPVHHGDEALCEIQFGHIARPMTERDSVEAAQFEVCAHRWIATRDEEAMFAVLNDSKYGHRAKNGLLSLNLLRSPTFPDRTADRGEHEFSYAFRPSAPDDLVGVLRAASALGAPLRIAAPGTELEASVAVDDPGVLVETIKPAEDGEGVVLRLAERLGRRVTTGVRVRLPHGRARRTDLLERDLGPADLERLELGPFEIATIRLEPAS